jgi:RNA polymerase sigma factor (sigma-70 family)
MTPVFRRKTDDQAFERLYERHARDVYRYAAAMLGEAADAEDVTQTTFLNAYRSFQDGMRPEKPRSWLIAIAHNVCRQRFRQAQRRPHEVAFDEGIEPPGAAPDPATPTVADLRRALSQLPPNQRAALVMRELEGSSYAEIASTLGISVSALETLLFRARRALREQLEDQLTCGEAGLAIQRQLDGELPFGQRRALRAHLRGCRECTSIAQSLRAQRRALRTLVLVPVPNSVSHWFGNQHAAAAGGSAGAGGIAVLGATTGGGAGATALLGGLAAKTAAVLFAGIIVGGGAYTAVTAGADALASPADGPVVRTPTRGSTVSLELPQAAVVRAKGHGSARSRATTPLAGTAGHTAFAPEYASGPSSTQPGGTSPVAGRPTVADDDSAASSPAGGASGRQANPPGSQPNAPAPKQEGPRQDPIVGHATSVETSAAAPGASPGEPNASGSGQGDASGNDDGNASGKGSVNGNAAKANAGGQSAAPPGTEKRSDRASQTQGSVRPDAAHTAAGERRGARGTGGTGNGGTPPGQATANPGAGAQGSANGNGPGQSPPAGSKSQGDEHAAEPARQDPPADPPGNGPPAKDPRADPPVNGPLAKDLPAKDPPGKDRDQAPALSVAPAFPVAPALPAAPAPPDAAAPVANSPGKSEDSQGKKPQHP